MKNLKLYISILLPLMVLLMPSQWLPFDGLTVIEHRFIAIFLLATLLWILEPIPIFSTSILLIVLQLVMVSDKGFFLFTAGQNSSQFGELLSYKKIMATFASPVIMLFLGGFFLAMAAKKYRLDLNLARVLLKPFGQKPRNVMLGLMVVTAIFSMFMSNTATTAMMLAILTPVLALFEDDDPGKIAFILAVPFAANIGGLGTPIGTPPNAIAMKYLTGGNTIEFGTWMFFAVPFVFVMLFILWSLLIRMYPAKSQSIDLDIKSRFLKNGKAITVYITFTVTILLWLLGSFHGMNSYVVAMIPVAVFVTTQIITAKDLQSISWDVLWLLTGGIALGQGLEDCGLASHIVKSIPFEQFSPLIIVFLATAITFMLANFMSHTAAANLLLPIMAALGTSISSLEPLGGSRMIILVVTFAASLSMSLPISTPPNAMAHATGALQSRDMFKIGFIVGLVGLAGSYVLMYILKMVHFL